MKRDNLKLARIARGMTAMDLGELIGMREHRVYGIERGRYRARRDEALIWASALRLNPEAAFPELFGAEVGVP